jgi:hypothetical protein
MSLLKASAISLGVAGAFVLGVWTSPYVRDEQPRTVAMQNESPAEPAAPAVAPVRAERPSASTPRVAATPRIAASAEPVKLHVKPLLNSGTDMTIASAGFPNAEKFVSTAHAARNTQIPFVVLKHRVVTQGQTLAAAIRESKPELDATLEANRALAEARADLARLATAGVPGAN